LTEDTNGTLYGTTNQGGDPNCSTITSGCGTIYSLSQKLPAFVEARPMLGGVGSPVIIVGTGLSGATGVTFDGTPAKFAVVSSTEIRTNVPAGATTGKVVVTLPSRTLATVLPFTVK
jgi:uncharacterized repeat protein (TIGR03803 family)